MGEVYTLSFSLRIPQPLSFSFYRSLKEQQDGSSRAQRKAFFVPFHQLSIKLCGEEGGGISSDKRASPHAMRMNDDRGLIKSDVRSLKYSPLQLCGNTRKVAAIGTAYEGTEKEV